MDSSKQGRNKISKSNPPPPPSEPPPVPPPPPKGPRSWPAAGTCSTAPPPPAPHWLARPPDAASAAALALPVSGDVAAPAQTPKAAAPVGAPPSPASLEAWLSQAQRTAAQAPPPSPPPLSGPPSAVKAVVRAKPRPPPGPPPGYSPGVAAGYPGGSAVATAKAAAADTLQAVHEKQEAAASKAAKEEHTVDKASAAESQTAQAARQGLQDSIPGYSFSHSAISATTGSPKRVLVLGLPKCGTTSLHEAFKSIGLTSVHWALRAGEDLSADKQLRLHGVGADERLIARLMQRAAAENKAPLAHLPPTVNAVAEMNGLYWTDGGAEGFFPQMSLLEELVRWYPDAHYILNVRPIRNWIASVNSHNDMRQRLASAELPGLPRGAGYDDGELRDWVGRHHDRVQQVLSKKRARLLVFDIEQHGERELSTFLGRRVTWKKCNASAW